MKTYPDGSQELMVCSKPIFHIPGWEEREKPEKYVSTWKQVEKDLRALGWAASESERPRETNTQRAARRAAIRVRDIALCNSFEWFITLTLDEKRIDRYDIQAITKKLNTWLDNQVRRKGIRYVIVPELHKDGAYHFHGLIAGNVNLISSGTWIIPGHKKPVRARSKKQALLWATKGPEEGYKKPVRARSKKQALLWATKGPEEGYKEVYNLEDWKLGFSSAIRLNGEYRAVVNYVSKYITKQVREAGGKIAGRWYFSGGDLREPEIEYPDISLQELSTKEADLFVFEIPEAFASFGIMKTIRQNRIVDPRANASGSQGEKPAEAGETPHKNESEGNTENENTIPAG